MSGLNALRIAVAAALLVASTAQAELFRAYLAADGNDAQPCTLPAPCRLLPAALNAVAAGGEIWMLDSANYNAGTVHIAKSVSILAVPGVVGSVVATGGPAFEITTPGLTVALRNLVIAPAVTLPGGTFGVYVNITSGVASSISIEDSVIAGVPLSGVFAAGAVRLKVASTTVRNVGQNSFAFELLDGAEAAISSTHMLNNGGGVAAWSSMAGKTTTATVSDSLISGFNYGVNAHADASGATARISVTRSTIERTSRALESHAISGGSTEVDVGSSLIVDNEYAWYQFGTSALILSLGNNQMRGNGSSTGVLTPLPPQ
jgi:hypothetical protein